MDIFAHALLAAVLFKDQPWLWAAVLLSVFPDVISNGPYGIYWLFRHQEIPPQNEGTDRFCRACNHLYIATHSIPIALLVGVVFSAFTGGPWWPVLGWLLHIMIDIPMHNSETFPTPFLWPFTDYNVEGIPWRKRTMLASIYGALAVAVWIRFF